MFQKYTQAGFCAGAVATRDDLGLGFRGRALKTSPSIATLNPTRFSLAYKRLFSRPDGEIAHGVHHRGKKRVERRPCSVPHSTEDSRENRGAHPPRRCRMHSYFQVTAAGLCVRHFEESAAATILAGDTWCMPEMSFTASTTMTAELAECPLRTWFECWARAQAASRTPYRVLSCCVFCHNHCSISRAIRTPTLRPFLVVGIKITTLIYHPRQKYRERLYTRTFE